MSKGLKEVIQRLQSNPNKKPPSSTSDQYCFLPRLLQFKNTFFQLHGSIYFLQEPLLCLHERLICIWEQHGPVYDSPVPPPLASQPTSEPSLQKVPLTSMVPFHISIYIFFKGFFSATHAVPTQDTAAVTSLSIFDPSFR